MANYELVFDIGSQYVSAGLKKDGFFDKIPAVVALGGQDCKQVVAVGVEALRLENNVNNSLKISRPILEGAIMDVEGAKALISALLSRLINYKMSVFSRYNVTCALPCGMIGSDKKVIESTFLSLGARQVCFVETPIADSVQLFNEFHTRQGIVANLGYDCADIAVVVSNNIVSGCTAYHAGKHLTQAIAERINNKYMMQISYEQAEYLKINCASLYPNDSTIVAVTGRNTQQGKQEMVNISSKELYDTVVDFVKKYVVIVQSLLSSLPTDVAPSVRQGGLLLCGGSAKLAGLDLYLQHELGIKVCIASQEQNVTLNGLLQYTK